MTTRVCDIYRFNECVDGVDYCACGFAAVCHRPIEPCPCCGGSGIVTDSAPTDRGTETREVECDCVDEAKARP